MSYPTLKRGDNNDDVKTLQTALNKVGAMLNADGDFGAGTQRGVSYAQDIAGLPMTGVADSNLWNWLETQPEPFDKLDTNGVAFIAREETGGLDYYQKVTCWPCYPGEESGITIGVGYDLRFNTEDNFKSTWAPYLPNEYVEELIKDIGEIGSASRVDELKAKGIEIPFKSAWPVFTNLTLPRFYQETTTIYSSLDVLPKICRSVLVSIVFNRGPSLSGDRRKEMKEIQTILETANDPHLTLEQKKAILKHVGDQITSMKRLWAPTSGLVGRRDHEAALWEEGLNSW